MVTFRELPKGEKGTLLTLPWVRQYPLIVKLTVNWPFQIRHEEQDYTYTGKDALRRNDDCPCAEYASAGDTCIWLGLDGKIQED